MPSPQVTQRSGTRTGPGVASPSPDEELAGLKSDGVAQRMGQKGVYHRNLFPREDGGVIVELDSLVSGPAE